MKKSLSKLILFILLIIPILIFLFLKFFGTNYHDLPVYYEDGVDTTFALCNFPKGQHRLENFTYVLPNGQLMGLDLNNRIDLYYLSQNIEAENSKKILNALNRVQQQFREWPYFQITVLRTDINQATFEDDITAMDPQWIFGFIPIEQAENFARCGLVLDFETESEKVNSTLVLVDEEHRIRGYYDGLDISEIDRLILEVRILQHNWK